MTDAYDIVLADQQVVFLDAFSSTLTDLGHQVLATVSTRLGLLESVRNFQPTLCIIERQLLDGDSFDVIAQILSRSLTTQVVVLTADADLEPMRRALSAGAVGYLHKSRGVPALVSALRRIVAGEIVVDANFATPPPAGTDARNQPRPLATYLTPRELECLELVAAGLSTSVIAGRLGVSTTTIRSHVQAVLTKLGVHSRLEAAALAIRSGLGRTYLRVEPDKGGECDGPTAAGIAALFGSPLGTSKKDSA